jgi:hypothetical protein
MTFFSKKGKKSKIQNPVSIEPKTISGKSFSTKFLYPLRESMFKKSAKNHWSLVGRSMGKQQEKI